MLYSATGEPPLDETATREEVSDMLRILVPTTAFIAVAALIIALAACDSDNSVEAASPPEIPAGESPSFDSAFSGESKGEDRDGNGSGSAQAGASASASTSASGPDGVAGFTNPNPNGDGITLNSAPNEALKDAQPLDIITWNTPPTLSPGELTAEGVIQNGGVLFDPMAGEGSAFSVYYDGHDEPLVELLPDLGPMLLWLTDHTVAPTEWEVKGAKFTFRAYSPLFMDADPSALKLRVYGYDPNGNPAILSITNLTSQ